MKQRLVGAVVLMALVVIFVPMLLDDEPVVTSGGITKSNIPPQPEGDFPIRSVPRKEVVPLRPAASVVEPARVAGTESGEKPVKPAPEARTGLSAWVVQVASFKQRANAGRLVKRLQAKKLSAFVEQASVAGKTVFRVRVGPEVDRKRAEAIRARIERQFKLKGKIERYP